jgi:hypothetical protein
MTAVLICSVVDLDDHLQSTCLWGPSVERRHAVALDDALSLARAAPPTLVVVDRDLLRSVDLVAALREDPATRPSSIAVVARGEFAALELDLLQAGANVILRLPAGSTWDGRLTQLLAVPARRAGTFSVHFAVEAYAGLARGSGQAQALNLSTNGMLVECAFPLSIGDELALELQLPGPGPAVSGAGRVVRQARGGRFGIEFRRLKGDGARQIRQFVESFEG